MSGWAMPRRQTRIPAFLVAVLLHAGVLALVIMTPQKLPPPIGSSVPINIVSSQPTDVRQAAQAAQVQAAATPEPTPTASPQPAVPAPKLPSFTETPSAPKTQSNAKAQPATAGKHPTAPAQLDLRRMQQIIQQHQAGGQTTSSAPRGAARNETDLQARPDAGHGLSQSDLLGLTQLLERLWNPNCDVAGGSSVKLQVKFTVGFNGKLLGRPSAGGAESSSNPVVFAAARRAVDAVQEATPYAPSYYGQAITVNFDAKEACAKR